ncbi:trimeric intracellular cation channel family protein [Pontibacter sp. JAM-7]|uniref:trimeric intracellular cation channel family protein n=1 Tax=Pontibacter sp. JAM-7 TaxID=3366581 RepID=UPI003AF86DFF
MADLSLLYAAELIGVAVFAIAGALAAQGKRLDIFGVVVLAIVTSLGGGSIRDISLNSYPLVWIADNNYLWVAVAAAVFTFIFCRYLAYPKRSLLILDAMGLALFAVLGAEKAQAAGLAPIIVVMMGMITGAAGGMIRDILTGQIPLILQRDGSLYATCALAGALFYVLADQILEPALQLTLAALIVFLLRLAAIFANLRLPEFIMAGHDQPKSEQDKKP